MNVCANFQQLRHSKKKKLIEHNQKQSEMLGFADRIKRMSTKTISTQLQTFLDNILIIQP